MHRERIDADSRGGVGVKQTAEGPAAVEEQQQAVNGDTAARSNRGPVAKLGCVDRVDRKGTCVKLSGIAALDAGPEPIGFGANQVVAALQIVADLAAGNATRRVIIDREIREGWTCEPVVEIVVAEAAATEHADVQGRPVVK